MLISLLHRSAPRCYDCFDFAALAVKHAVTVLLNPDETVDDKLRIFQTFDDCVCRLVSPLVTNCMNVVLIGFATLT